MEVSEFIGKLDALKDELKDKDIFIVASNGLLVTPEIKVRLRNQMDSLDFSADTVEYVILTW